MIPSRAPCQDAPYPHNTRRSVVVDKIRKNRVPAAIAGLLALGGLGAGVAAAGFGGSAQPATVRILPAATTSVAPPAAPPVAPPAGSPGQPAPTADKAEPGGKDTDNVQEGDQNGPDNANEANDPKDANEANDPNEKPGTETPDDGKGPQGQNVSVQQ
jgi:hypothetical protein